MDLNSSEELILDVLRQRKLHGREIVSKLTASMGRGGIYPCLVRMEDRGLIESDSRRAESWAHRLYHTTEVGLTAFLMRHARRLAV